MMLRTVMLSGIAWASLATMAAAQEASGFDRPYWLNRSVIEAVGRAQVEVLPDRGAFQVTYEETAREAGDASAQAADRARLAVAAMRQRGGDAVLIRSVVTLQANYEEYRTRDGVVEQREGAENVRSYTSRVTLNVEITDIARASSVRAAALAVGPEQAQPLSFSLRESGESNRRAFQTAAEDAAARARAAARASSVALGPLLVLQEGQGPCLGSWYGDRPGTFALPPPPPPPAPPPPGALEEIQVTGSRGQRLVVTQEQIDRLDLPADIEPVTLTAMVCAVYAAG